MHREYFMKGFYPSGQENPSDVFTPSGALLKAMLVSSARGLERIVDESDSGSISITQITKYPSNDQGYGRIQLDNVLNFGKLSSRRPLSLFVMGAALTTSPYYVKLSTNTSHFYTFTTSSSSSQTSIRFEHFAICLFIQSLIT